ncbi:MAG: hypothetical protein SFX73_24750 [Kofleriaceae bacterium]|nr:hypothetical protein [Kofleriaceae bacterium]
MRTLASVLALSSALAGITACGNENDPSVSGVYPTAGFIGRTLRVQVSGDATHWTSSTTLDFGPGITVDSIALASETALFAEITIDDTVAPGLRDVVVKGEETLTLKNAFELESPVSANFLGTVAQGSVVQFTIINHDFDTPFDTTTTGDGFFTPIVYTNLELTPPPGVFMQIGEASPYSITGRMLINVEASPGPFVIESGAAGGLITTFASGENIDVQPRTAMPLTNGTRVDGQITNPYDSFLYEFTSSGSPGLALLRTATDDPNGVPGVAVLPESGSFDELIDYASSVAVVADQPQKLYAIVIDLDGFAGYPFSLHPSTFMLNTAPEAASNDTVQNAQVVTLPAQVTNASLSSDADEDWFKFTATAADAGKHLHVITTPGDQRCDPVVELFTGTNAGTAFGEPSSDADYHEDLVSTGTITAGNTYWVKVTWSPESTWGMANDSYNTAIFLE